MKAKLIRGLINIKPAHRHSVLTIGNFDGVHRGHQAVLQQTIMAARERGLQSMTMIFEPQPNEFFMPEKAKARLSRLREKYTSLSKEGVDKILCIHFDKAIAALSAEDFIYEILVKRLQVKHIVIGDDFRFGRDRLGDFTLLTQLGERCGFSVEKATTYTHQCDTQLARISSTMIRQALADGNLILAEQLLGRPFSMFGRVGHGHKRGRMIGFPTANLYLHRKVTPIKGVYAVKTYGLAIEPLFGVANIGNRPTVDGQGRTLLEVHLFNFNQDIYGRYLRVEFIHKIRDEKKYENFDALKAQIFKDSDQAKQYFGIEHE